MNYNSSSNDIEAVILDHGHTICATTCAPTLSEIGTIPFLAPGMEAQPYNSSVDI
jgi:hypothetical protein